MKKLPLFLIFAVLLTNANSQRKGLLDNKIVDYPVRNIDLKSEKYNKIYESVADMDENKKRQLRSNNLSYVEFLQNLGGGKYRVRSPARDGKFYLLKLEPESPDVKSFEVETMEGRIKSLKAFDDSIVDDTVLLIYIRQTDEVYKYKTVLGAIATIGVLKIEASEIKRITKSEFTQSLKDGESYIIQEQTGTKPCTACGGRGWIAGGLKKDSKSCNRCSAYTGKGKLPVYKKFQIKW